MTVVQIDTPEYANLADSLANSEVARFFGNIASRTGYRRYGAKILNSDTPLAQM
jgi:hypothetical protein